ncbi:MAG: DUF362 domain-containing protein [Tenericutes bacterium]|nr:DUF362 domain-containing protein [Mycoplasmatota bacterium]
MSLVSFVKIKKDTIHSFKKAINDSLNLIEFSFPSGARNVVIKPNLCYYWDHSTGATTDPRFAGALIEVIRENISSKVKISLVESDASAMKCKYAFQMLGYTKLSQEYDVKLVNLSEDVTQTVETSAGGYKIKLQIPQIIRDADLKINTSKIKYSLPSIQMTCALKNIFGCNPYPRKFQYHPRIGEVIVAINKAMKFDLCVIGENIASGIKPRRIGLVMTSKDPVAVDAAAAEIAGVNPKRLKFLQLAAKEGLGTTDYIQKGVSIDYFKALYPSKTPRSKVMKQAYELIVMLGLNKKLGLS